MKSIHQQTEATVVWRDGPWAVFKRAGGSYRRVTRLDPAPVDGADVADAVRGRAVAS